MIAVTYPSRHPAKNAISAMNIADLGPLDETSSSGRAGSTVEGSGEGEGSTGPEAGGGAGAEIGSAAIGTVG